MQEAADEAGLELNMEIPGAHTSTLNVAQGEQDELSQRLAQLRQTWDFSFPQNFIPFGFKFKSVTESSCPLHYL